MTPADAFLWARGLVLGTCALVVAISDGRRFRIPYRYLLPTAAVLTLVALLDSLVEPAAAGWSPILTLLVAGVVGGASFFLVRRLTRGALGLGDVAYSVVLAMGLGLLHWYLAVLVACGAAVAFGLLVRTLAFRGTSPRRRRLIPFGVFLSIGALVSALLAVCGGLHG